MINRRLKNINISVHECITRLFRDSQFNSGISIGRTKCRLYPTNSPSARPWIYVEYAVDTTWFFLAGYFKTVRHQYMMVTGLHWIGWQFSPRTRIFKSVCCRNAIALIEISHGTTSATIAWHKIKCCILSAIAMCLHLVQPSFHCLVSIARSPFIHKPFLQARCI